MTWGTTSKWSTRATGPRDAHGLAVLLLAAVLGVGTMLPQFGPRRPSFPPPFDAGILGRPVPGGMAIRTGPDTRAPGHRAEMGPAPSNPHLVGPLDLNTADAVAFQALPGIGPTLAQRILADRDAHGPFQTPEDLLRVPGIGPKRLERIRPLVRATEGP